VLQALAAPPVYWNKRTTTMALCQAFLPSLWEKSVRDIASFLMSTSRLCGGYGLFLKEAVATVWNRIMNKALRRSVCGGAIVPLANRTGIRTYPTTTPL